MYHYTTPPLGISVNLPSAIASANDPHAAALSLSTSDSLTANQLQNHVTQARRAREQLIDRVTKPPEPGWQSAINRISDTVNRMEKVLSFLQLQTSLPARPDADMDALAVYPSGTAMQQSGSTPDVPPSAAESPAALRSASPMAQPEVAVDAAVAREPRVIYVMDEGVMIVGLSDADVASERAQEQMPLGTSVLQTTTTSDQGKSANVVVNLPLTEDQQRASQDLIALARKAYAQLRPENPEQSADLITTTQVGLTGDLEKDPATAPSPERITPAETLHAARDTTQVETPKLAETSTLSARKDPLLAMAEPFARDASEEAAETQQKQQIIALQLDGHNDIIYIVPPAKATMDLIA
ncbi:chemotaxis protein CheA [Tritonibacter horizontis]|uniref:Uncharacterized protein n=1 Tax=Tritonibacter horizontis TaxID=1768241 RepID=A0A132BUX6_9RHOB|nr:chemotaxis protein CheA [Tritonibacter horizontis]KUP92094.1 hypothetical protein TRIHO_31130 [Tritonibacter horizontis]